MGFLSRIGSWFGAGQAPSYDEFLKQYPTDEELNEDPQFNREFAVGVAADIESGLRQMRATTAEQGKWLLSSLLAVNSAGAFAAFQIEAGEALQAWALGAFVVGIIAALLSGHLGIRAGLRLAGPMGENLGYWRAVQINGFRIRDTETAFMAFPGSALQTARGPYAFGYLSLISFIIGCGLAMSQVI